MQVLKCDFARLAKRNIEFNVKKICKRSEMPDCAEYFFTIYRILKPKDAIRLGYNNEPIDIYKTPSGCYYAKESNNIKL